MALKYITNSKGDEIPFSRKKVYRSVRQVGVKKERAYEIADTIEQELYPGIRTAEIFRKVRKLIRQENSKPTGFPFEKFIGEVFKEAGFETRINQHLPGFCLTDYEIDFVMKKDKLIYVGECKYRNRPGERIHSKEALANQSRFIDIFKGSYFKREQKQGFKIKPIMITNAKFTTQSINYFSCIGTEFLGWNQPKEKGLESLITEYQLYPITALPSLKGRLKEVLIAEKIMLVKDILNIDSKRLARKLSIPSKSLKPLIKEAEILLSNN